MIIFFYKIKIFYLHVPNEIVCIYVQDLNKKIIVNFLKNFFSNQGNGKTGLHFQKYLSYQLI